MVDHAGQLCEQFFDCGQQIGGTGEVYSTGTQCKSCGCFQSEVLESYTLQTGIVPTFGSSSRLSRSDCFEDEATL